MPQERMKEERKKAQDGIDVKQQFREKRIENSLFLAPLDKPVIPFRAQVVPTVVTIARDTMVRPAGQGRPQVCPGQVWETLCVSVCVCVVS